MGCCQYGGATAEQENVLEVKLNLKNLQITDLESIQKGLSATNMTQGIQSLTTAAGNSLAVIGEQTTEGLVKIKEGVDIEKVSEFVDKNITENVIMIGNQVEGVVREGLQKTIDSIQDLNLKKRVSDIVYPIFRKYFVYSLHGIIEDTYKIHEIIGQGSFSTVRRASHIDSGLDRAVKVVTKNSLTETQTLLLSNETEILKNLDHPNIIKIIEVIEDTTKINIVTELCTGGEMFERIIKFKTFNETMAAGYMFQILSALIHIHDSQVVHLNLKPENIVFVSPTEDRLKIIDFGIAQKETQKSASNKINCTPYYIAPEFLAGEFSCKSDIWSCGVILYIMLSGKPPFIGKTESEILEKVSRGVFNFSGKEWQGVSKDGKNFIQRLLTKDVNKRPTAEEAWNDPWVQNRVRKNWTEDQNHIMTLNLLAQFNTNSKFQQSTLTYIASHLTKSDELKELEKAFQILDTNGDGKLSLVELKNGYSNISISSLVDVGEIIAKCDLDISGMINYSEFITAALDWEKVLTHDRLTQAFKAVDADMNGTIGVDDIRRFLGGGEMEEIYDKILQDADVNGDGVIDFEEFKKILLEITNII